MAKPASVPAASQTKIRVMISSRCNDEIVFGGRKASLSEVRIALRNALDAELLLGSTLFETWINEDAPPAGAGEDAWEVCMRQVRSADVVLVLYNGNSGWTRDGGEIGICHAEFHTALSTGAGRVRLIEVPKMKPASGAEQLRHQNFQTFVETHSLFRGAVAANGEEAIDRCRQALREAVPDLVRKGVRETQKSRFNMGDALDWTRLDYPSRKLALEDAARRALGERRGSTTAPAPDNWIAIEIAGTPILTLVHGVPASMSQSAAREMVGQPFLHDHNYAPLLVNGRGGPMHFIACHRGVSESQAIRHLGCPDATVVSGPFGVFLADEVHKVQVVFLQNCRDATATSHALQRAFEWLLQSGEGERIAKRAASRARIVNAIANESSKIPASLIASTEKKARRAGSHH